MALLASPDVGIRRRELLGILVAKINWSARVPARSNNADASHETITRTMTICPLFPTVPNLCFDIRITPAVRNQE